MAIANGTSYLVGPDEGDLVWDGPIGTTVRVSTERTGGLLSICDFPIAPGFMVPPHTHRETDEWSYVIDGRVGARVGDEEFTAEPGSWILKPRGVMHTFWNAGPEPARIIELLTPGRFEHFFRTMTVLATRGELDDERMGALAEDYGTTVSMDWVDDLASRYGLEVTI